MKKREEEEKSNRKEHFDLTGIWTHELCLCLTLSTRPMRLAKFGLWCLGGHLEASGRIYTLCILLHIILQSLFSSA